MSKVKVYYFKGWDLSKGEDVTSPLRATIDTIKKCNGTPIEDTCIEVDASTIDDDGFHPAKEAQ